MLAPFSQPCTPDNSRRSRLDLASPCALFGEVVNNRDFIELREEVGELRRRLDDQAAVARKTQLAVGALAESLEKVVAAGRRDRRVLNLNSFVAYFLFTLLLGGGFFLLYNQRADSLVKARDHAVQDRESLLADIATLKKEIRARDESTKAAADFYKLLKGNRRSEAIAQYPEMQRLNLTPTERELFADGVKKARGAIVDAGYLTGLDSFRKKDYDKAVTEMRRGLAYEEEGPRAAQMRYYLGVALFKRAEYEDAARQLELALAGRVEQAGKADTRFYLASCFEQLGKFADARTEYDKFASTYPTNEFAFVARRKSAQLARSASPKN